MVEEVFIEMDGKVLLASGKRAMRICFFVSKFGKRLKIYTAAADAISSFHQNTPGERRVGTEGAVLFQK